MQLKYTKSVKSRIITIELETANFTKKEDTALERFGEPEIEFEKLYEGIFPVQFKKRVKTGFKVRVKFDGTQDIDLATDAANKFFEDIQEVLEEKMRALIDALDELEMEFETKTGYIDLKY